MCEFFKQGVSEASLSVVADWWAGDPVFRDCTVYCDDLSSAISINMCCLFFTWCFVRLGLRYYKFTIMRASRSRELDSSDVSL